MWTVNSLDFISHFLSALHYYSLSFLFAESLDFVSMVTSVDCERVKDIQTNFIQRRCGCLTSTQQSRLSRLQERPESNKEGAERDGRQRTGGWVMHKSQTPQRVTLWSSCRLYTQILPLRQPYFIA